MRHNKKIEDKRAAYQYIEANRSTLTLEEMGKQLNVTKSRVWQMAKDLGLNVKLNKWRSSKVEVVASMN